MEFIDNVGRLLGDELKKSLTRGSKLKIAAACFSIYAFESLKRELANIDSMECLTALIMS